jgi:hypothetical protein
MLAGTSKALHVGQPINWANPLTRGLKALWLIHQQPPFFGGSRLLDLCNSQHGAFVSSPEWIGAYGRPGGYGALRYDGVDDYTLTSGTPVTEVPLTLAAWMFFIGASSTRTILAVCNSASNLNLWTIGTDDSAGTVSAGTADGSSARSSTLASAATVGQWGFLTGVFASNSSRIVYYNGVAGAEQTSSRTPSGVNRVSQGALAALTPSGFHDHAIDCAMIFNRALTSAEVMALFHATSEGLSGALNYYRRAYIFDVGAGGAPTKRRYTLTTLGVG